MFGFKQMIKCILYYDKQNNVLIGETCRCKVANTPTKMLSLLGITIIIYFEKVLK